MDTSNVRFIELLKGVPKRAVELLIKLLSRKGVALGLSVWLLMAGKLETWGFITVVGMVLFDTAFLKYIDKR